MHLREFINKNIEKIEDENSRIFVSGLYSKYVIWMNDNYREENVCKFDDFKNEIVKDEFLGEKNAGKQWSKLRYINDVDTFNQKNKIDNIISVNSFVDKQFKFVCEKVCEGISHLHPDEELNIINTFVRLGYFERHYGDYGICLKNFLDVRKGDIIGITMQLTDQFTIEKYYNPNLSADECIENLGNFAGNIKMFPEGGKYSIYTYKMNCSLI